MKLRKKKQQKKYIYENEKKIKKKPIGATTKPNLIGQRVIGNLIQQYFFSLKHFFYLLSFSKIKKNNKKSIFCEFLRNFRAKKVDQLIFS